MSEKMGLLELAVRCEAATGADRELDCAIYEALGSPKVSIKRPGTHGDDVCIWAPFYTASLEAALSTVPDGWRWWKAGYGRTGGSRMVVTDTDSEGRFTVLGECPCPDTVESNALALTAASLRARHALALSKGSDV